MNILKKVKLTLLATSVMFSPQVGHAADQERDDHATLTRTAPSASSSQLEGIPTAARDVSDISLLSTIYGKNFDLELLDVEQTSSSLAKIRKVHETTSSEEFATRVAAIKKNFKTSVFDKFLFMFTKDHFLDVVKVSATALELSVSEIDTRGAAINEMVNTLFTFEASGIEGSLVPFVGAQKYFNFRGPVVDLIDYALTLSPQEISERAGALKRNEALLTNTLAYRPEIIQSLFKQHPDEFERRAVALHLLEKYFSNEERGGASEIEIDALEKNAQLVMEQLIPFLEKIENGNFLSPRARNLLNFLNNTPEDNASRIAEVEKSWDTLSKMVPRMEQSQILTAALEWIPSEEIASRTAAIFQHQNFLPLTGEGARVNTFATKSAEEIEHLASVGRTLPSSSSQ